VRHTVQMHLFLIASSAALRVPLAGNVVPRASLSVLQMRASDKNAGNSAGTSMTLLEKAAALRRVLDLSEDQSLAQTVDSAARTLGVSEAKHPNLMSKVDACLQMIGSDDDVSMAAGLPQGRGYYGPQQSPNYRLGYGGSYEGNVGYDGYGAGYSRGVMAFGESGGRSYGYGGYDGFGGYGQDIGRHRYGGGFSVGGYGRSYGYG